MRCYIFSAIEFWLMEYEMKYKMWDRRFVLIQQLLIHKREVKLGQSKSETESYARPSCCALLKPNFHFYTFLASKRLKIIYYLIRKHYNTENTDCDFLFYFYNSIKQYESLILTWASARMHVCVVILQQQSHFSCPYFQY